MPNRTIYVADADLPIFEKAQKLAGDNLSAAIAQALHYFVEKEEAKSSGFEEITVKVGKGRPYLTKQFRGRLLGKRRIRVQKGTRLLTLVVYLTAKGRFVIYTKNTASWSDWSKSSMTSAGDWNWDWDYDWSNYDWSSYFEDDEHRLDVYNTLDELKDNIPEELYESIMRYNNGEDVEILDI
ncbi:MAG TPA: EXLDI protein [Ktedonobacteraceae bacterium]